MLLLSFFFNITKTSFYRRLVGLLRIASRIISRQQIAEEFMQKILSLLATIFNQSLDRTVLQGAETNLSISSRLYSLMSNQVKEKNIAYLFFLIAY